MLTKLEQFWARIVKATPGFGQADDIKVTMTIGAIRKLVAKSHKDGFHCGGETANTLRNLGKQGVDPDITDAFSDIFGGKL